MLKNLKIGGKLALGFGLLLVISGVIAIVGSQSIRHVNRQYDYVLGGPVRGLQILSEIELNLMDLRRVVTFTALHTGDAEMLHTAEMELRAAHATLSRSIYSFRSTIDNDDSFTDAEKREFYRVIDILEGLIDKYMAEVANPTLAYARANDRDGVFAAIGRVQYAEILETFESIESFASGYKQEIVDHLHAQTDFTSWLLLIMSGVALVLGVAVSILIAKSITTPLYEVVDALGEVSRGNLNVRLNQRSDEIGVLTKATQNMVETLNLLLHDIDDMSNDHDLGDIDMFMDEKKYTGTYNTVVKKINYMVEQHINTKKKVINVYTEIANGHFDAPIEKFPRKKAFLNDAVESMRTQIKSVSTEVNAMTKHAANGNLRNKIETTRYQGGWREIMTGLNHVAQAVSEPLTEINTAMNKLSTGQFDTKVTGNYKGDFKSIQDSVNTTIGVLSGYIAVVSKMLSSIADGDLSHSVNHEFAGSFSEIKNSINHITKTLRNTISEISDSSAQVFGGSKLISESAAELANGATTQASSVEELNAMMEQISIQTRENAENANSATTLADNSVDSAQNGNTNMQMMLNAMLQIKSASKSISRIIKDIQDIAFNINLLSLNAAVEAARAGEHGKGFAVVAAEVRNLAARSQKCASETAEIIETSIHQIESGANIAESTAESFATIVANAKTVLATVSTIAAASNEQYTAIEHISTGLGQITGVVQSNSAVAQEAAAASQQLSAQAEMLQHMVKYFKL
ncbi:MAG: methyl-accepting chemotaxis protein [Defluviitaleaceae bacterium]|nr:methyl-accepting chemotaxis protein [Defluviitaleaceae bacterium]